MFSIGSHVLPQVLLDADYEGSLGDHRQAEATQEEKEQHSSAAQEFMSKHRQADSHARAEHGARRKPLRVSSQYIAQASDHALGGGFRIRLDHFQVAQLVRPLRLFERRYLEDAASLPAVAKPVPYPEGGAPKKRPCIVNESTGTAYIELPRASTSSGSLHRPCIHACVDQGTVGWPAWNYFLECCPIRGTLWQDLWHRATNDIKNAVVASGLWLTLLERVCIWNVEGAAHWGKTCQAAQHLLRYGSSSDPLFTMLAEGIAADHGDNPLDHMSPGRLEKLWRGLKESKVTKGPGKGDRVKLGRWLSWWDASNARHDSWHEMLLFLIVHGFKEGYWTDWESSPLGSAGMAGIVGPGAEEPDAQQKGQPPGIHADKHSAPQTVKEFNKDLEARRKQGRNSIELCIIVLSNSTARRLMHLLGLTVAPLRESLGKEEVMAKTRGGTMEMYTGWSRGSQNKSFQRVSAVLVDGASLDTIGFHTHTRNPDPATLKDDTFLAQTVNLAINLVGTRLQSLMMYSHSVPGLFAALVYDEAAVIQDTLEKLHKVWLWLQPAEQDAITKGEVQRTLTSRGGGIGSGSGRCLSSSMRQSSSMCL